MNAGLCWVLNLDAEIELDRLQNLIREKRTPSASSYTTPKPIREQIARYAAPFIAALPPDTVVLSDDPASQALAQGRRGVCWCPTPSALEQLTRAGASPLPSPPQVVLLAVNHRAFCAALGQPLPDARFAENAEQIFATLRTQSPSGAWLCKRPLSFAGRGQLRVSGGDEPLRAADRRWLNESLPHGGLQIEPLVQIIAEYSVHGLIRRDGSNTLGQPCEQTVDQYRAWKSAALASPASLPPSDHAALLNEATRVANALAQAGYFGPFCVDSYTWRDTSGALHLNPRGEINARMTMAYPIGMGKNWLQELLNL
ncbi:MAG TPA: hypothetical protein VL137_14190 [Polyangiaceae bacterium]|nr:hypothetical protein [Polyangiaceae bacterium]